MSSRPIRAACAAAAAFCFTVPSLAEEPLAEAPPAIEATALDPVVTVATRAPLAASEALAPVVVIDRATIARSLAADLTDLLRFTAGVEVGRNGGPGQTSSIFLRGSESNHALVLLDGVELNPGTIGGAPLAAIPLTSIERIEIVFGPRSTLYGSEAIGGVVNIVTKRGGERPAFAAAANAGGDDTQQYSLSAGGRAGAFDLALDVERFATGGYRIQPAIPLERGNDRLSATAALGWRGGLWDARLRAFVSDGTQEYFDFLSAPVSQSYRDSTTSLTLVRDSGSWRSTLLLASYDDEIAQDQPNPFTAATDFVRTARESVDWQNDLDLGRHGLTLGAAWSDESSAAEAFGAYHESTRVVAVYAQDRLDLGADDLALAARLSDHSTAGDQLSWNLEYGHAFDAALRLVANLGSGFRAPDSTDRYTPCCGNPALEPEEAAHAELALEWRAAERSALRVGAFQTRIDDLISFGPSFVLENIDRAEVRGLEAGWRTVADSWSWELRALVQDTEDLATGQPLPRRADRTLTSRYHRTLGAFGFGLDLLGSSGTKDSSFSTVRNAGYGLVDLSASWAASAALAFRLRLENAFDKDYVTAAGYANPGRSLFLGAAFQL
jgi:vitamin B12 transporter